MLMRNRVVSPLLMTICKSTTLDLGEGCGLLQESADDHSASRPPVMLVSGSIARCLQRPCPARGVTDTSAPRTLHTPSRKRAGVGGIAVRERQIQCRKLGGKWRANVGKLRGNSGAVPKAHEASKSNTSAQGTHRTNKHATGTSKQQLRENEGNCGNLRKVAKSCEKLRT